MSMIETMIHMITNGAIALVIIIILTCVLIKYVDVMNEQVSRGHWLGAIMQGGVIFVIVVILCMALGCIVDFAMFIW